ncbi:MAG: three-Cys-motif partner protein TcmP [Opitutales bacterium]|nr:three-Cys-motif partner protein TcmP [Opitutales bacterium]
MSSIKTPIWKAEDHTIAKLEILRSYMLAWVPILARNSRVPLMYIDGFSGPGEYSNGVDGSPIVVSKAIHESLSNCLDKVSCSKVICLFIEADKRRYCSLLEKVNQLSDSSISCRCIYGKFEDKIKELRLLYSSHIGGDSPLFVFVDPFGVKGIPLDVLKLCMEGKRSELLINLDVDGIARVYAANYKQQLSQIFGDDSCVEELDIDTFSSMSDKGLRILELYKRQLRQLVGVKYTYQFEMRGNSDRINYYLVFASNHKKGLIRMKEAMKKVDQYGDFCFSDANSHQRLLFEKNSLEDNILKIKNRFMDREVSLGEVEDFALCETTLSSISRALKSMEASGAIHVNVRGGVKRRRGSFLDEQISSIRFTKETTQPMLF